MQYVTLFPTGMTQAYWGILPNGPCWNWQETWFWANQLAMFYWFLQSWRSRVTGQRGSPLQLCCQLSFGLVSEPISRQFEFTCCQWFLRSMTDPVVWIVRKISLTFFSSLNSPEAWDNGDNNSLVASAEKGWRSKTKSTAFLYPV